VIQPKCAACQEVAFAKATATEELQRKESSDAEPASGRDLEQYVTGLNGTGQSLPAETRSFIEPKLGYDFGKVKVQ